MFARFLKKSSPPVPAAGIGGQDVAQNPLLGGLRVGQGCVKTAQSLRQNGIGHEGVPFNMPLYAMQAT